MWNDEVLNMIVIRNKDGKVIAELDCNRLTCNNRKFSIKSGSCEDVLEIQLNQRTYG